MSTISSGRRETDSWQETYANADEIARRRREIPSKLASLGITSQTRGAAVLDLCCGHGETLDALYTIGLRKLWGVDMTVPPTVACDPRFNVHQGDALNTMLAGESFDWITCIHSMHHFASASNVRRFVEESWRLLRPGGRVAIIDFPASLQIRLAFWFFRQPRLHCTRYMRYFGSIVQQEWSFLEGYLRQWPEVNRLLRQGRFEIERETNTFFYFYLTLRKPIALPSRGEG